MVRILGQATAITRVRSKDRFDAMPTAGGWRDYQLTFYFNDDPNRHICEVQVVHRDLLMARKGLPGHAIYGKVRNASELHELLLGSRTRLRWTRNDALRAGFNDAELRAAGFDGDDIVLEALPVDENEKNFDADHKNKEKDAGVVTSQ